MDKSLDMKRLAQHLSHRVRWNAKWAIRWTNRHACLLVPLEQLDDSQPTWYFWKQTTQHEERSMAGDITSPELFTAILERIFRRLRPRSVIFASPTTYSSYTLTSHEIYNKYCKELADDSCNQCLKMKTYDGKRYSNICSAQKHGHMPTRQRTS